MAPLLYYTEIARGVVLVGNFRKSLNHQLQGSCSHRYLDTVTQLYLVGGAGGFSVHQNASGIASLVGDGAAFDYA